MTWLHINDGLVGSIVGRVDGEDIYRTVGSAFVGELVGRVTGDTVYAVEGVSRRQVGFIRVDDVYACEFVSQERVGYIRGDRVYSTPDGSLYGPLVGRIDGSHVREGAAALLLLFQGDISGLVVAEPATKDETDAPSETRAPDEVVRETDPDSAEVGGGVGGGESELVGGAAGNATDLEREERIRYTHRMRDAIQKDGVLDLQLMKAFLKFERLFDERHLLLWASRFILQQWTGQDRDDLKSAVTSRYEEWAQKIGSQYAADEAAAANMSAFDLGRNAVISGAIFLWLIGSHGWITSLFVALALGAALSWLWGRLRTLFSTNFRKFERLSLQACLDVSDSEACRLVPNDFSWFWNISGRFDLERSKKLSKLIEGFKRDLKAMGKLPR